MGTSLLILRYMIAPVTVADAFSLRINTFAHDPAALTRETLPSSALTGYWTWWASIGASGTARDLGTHLYMHAGGCICADYLHG